MRTKLLSLPQYGEICSRADISPNYHPSFTEYYFSRLRIAPKILGKYDRHGELIAVFPTHLIQVFPNPVHRILLSKSLRRLVEIGQPESLVRVVDPRPITVPLNRCSPTTSSLRSPTVRGFGGQLLTRIAIARSRRHKRLTIRQRDFFESRRKAFFADKFKPGKFADVYVRPHGLRWGCSPEDLLWIRRRILTLYRHVFGVVMELRGAAVAVQLCHKVLGPWPYYVDFVNSGVRLAGDNSLSYGSAMILTCLRRARARHLHSTNTSGFHLATVMVTARPRLSASADTENRPLMDT